LLSISPANAIPGDLDDDGILDGDDDDVDGDGIPNSEERGEYNTGQILWNHNSDNGQSDSADTEVRPDYFASSTNLTFGPGVFENPDYAYTYILSGADQPDFASAKTNDDYVQVSFTPAVEL